MIRTFADKNTRSLYEAGKSRKFPSVNHSRATRKWGYVDLATCIDVLKVLPGKKQHWLTNDREELHAIAINDQWRICFRFEDGDAWAVEVCDYH
ncbi:MAG: proteic killer suppression protein [Gammaproteobacteria bacterium]|jgi:proteic killer suppression protein